ncbi:MAG TPA: Gfo/Idh/MocA family oxidoreductase [Thermoanaerobaculia bacterium]|nr:Gfo/Idh/MocA family oxidoreductase [Thermoanaerobaculia bacterium]
MRLGFVGLGWIGTMRLEAVSAVAEVAALCEAAPQCLEETARAHPGAAPFSDFGELLARSGDLRLDGIVIATPNSLHAPQTLAALDRGLAVFCQKPLALNACEAREMVEAAQRADRLLGVDYSYRFTEGARTLRRAVEAGELGRVFSVDTVFHNAYGPDKPWCFDPRLSGGGALMDLGVHLIDLTLWLLGDPGVKEVHGGAWKGGQPLDAGEVDDFASARIELDGGASVTVAVSWNAHAGQDCVIRLSTFGAGGGAEFRNVDGSFYDFELARFSGRSGEVVARESRGWMGGAILDWAERLGKGSRFDPEIGRSVRVSEVVDAVYGRE